MTTQEFKKRKTCLEDDEKLTMTTSQITPLSDIVFILEEENKYLRHHINTIYPNLKYSVINFGTKYNIFDKETEDLSYDFVHIDDNIGINCFIPDLKDKYRGNPLFIDGNKLIIYGNWNKEINDEIIFLILNYQIDIVIIKDMYWDEPIDKLPNRILSIKIYSDYFNQPLINLPSGLEILCIKSGGTETHGIFNKPINNISTITTYIGNQTQVLLPSTFQYMSFGIYSGGNIFTCVTIDNTIVQHGFTTGDVILVQEFKLPDIGNPSYNDSVLINKPLGNVVTVLSPTTFNFAGLDLTGYPMDLANSFIFSMINTTIRTIMPIELICI